MLVLNTNEPLDSNPTWAQAKAWCLRLRAEASHNRMGARAKAWCLLIHPEASLYIVTGAKGQGESLVPPLHPDASLPRSQPRRHPQPSERNLFSVTAAVADVPAMCSTSFSSNILSSPQGRGNHAHHITGRISCFKLTFIEAQVIAMKPSVAWRGCAARYTPLITTSDQFRWIGK